MAIPRRMYLLPSVSGVAVTRQVAEKKVTTMPTDGKYVEGATPVVREYIIRGTKYIVNVTVNEGASEDATAKVRRLIRDEISRTSKKFS